MALGPTSARDRQIAEHNFVPTHVHPAATPSAAGFMSTTDKVKLEGVENGATADAGDTQGVWNTGTSNVERLISPSKLAAKLRNFFGMDGAAPAFACRGWVSFSEAGAVQGQGNVASVTKLGTGVYRINFATSLPTSTYAVSGAAAVSNANGTPITVCVQTKTVAALTVSIRYATSGSEGVLDAPASIAVFC